MPSRKTDPAGRAEAFLAALADDYSTAFEADRQVLSFAEFIALVQDDPRRFARSSAQYLIDAIEHFGSHEVTLAGRSWTRWNVFDAPFADGVERVVGHEMAQERLMTLLRNFVDERRVNRLVVLHGPNGSAKSSFVGCLMRALEAYSATPEGALYRFNWIFPVRVEDGGRLGFSASVKRVSSDTFAHLDDTEIAARLPAEANDNPLFLLDRTHRQAMLEQALNRWPEFPLSDGIQRGELGQRSRAIFDALLTSYRGDIRKVLRHVQVERFVISRTYRRGAVTVEPQMRVDAGVRQITADRSMGALPTALQSQTLFETYGALVEGNRGVIEFNDLLKRPVEANKYLLATSEKATVALEHAEMRLDAVLLATGNELYLEAFKQQPDWASYRGRMELVRMPYLLDFRSEQQIYDDLLQSVKVTKPVAPHTTFVLALWAVLTRLRRPEGAAFSPRIKDMVASLSPAQKAHLYAGGEMPAGLSGDERAELRSAIPVLFEQASEGPDYEGRFGASAREMKMLLLSALHREEQALAPPTILQELEALVKETTVYEWLSLDAEGDYRQPAHFIQVVRDAWLDRVEREVAQATRLVDDTEYGRVFDKYIVHVNHWLRKEKLTDPVTGRPVPADERMMEEIEQVLGRNEDARDFRGQIINQIAAFRIDNPDAPVDFERIFPAQIERLRFEYYESRKKEVARICRHVLTLNSDNRASLSPEETQTAQATVSYLCEHAGYGEYTAAQAVASLLSLRYADLSR